ncbi:MAG: winged helix-turn-helix domain-containing protein [Pseudomonadota bacterium]
MAIYRFEDFSLDSDNFVLSRNGTEIQTEPLVIDLLLEFARNPGRLLTRDDLVQSVWEGRFVSDTTISTAVKSARKALSDSGEAQRCIKTVRGRGFQFVGEVTGGHDAFASDQKIFRQPCLVVKLTSLDNALTDTEAQAFKRRFRTTLNRVPFLRIHGELKPPKPDADVQDIYSEIGVTHVADLLVTQSASDLVVDASLVETGSGLQIWARTFEVNRVAGSSEVLLFQIMKHFEPAMMKAMVTMFSGQGETNSPEVLLLEAAGAIATYGWNKRSFDIARQRLDAAIDADPGMALAHAYAAIVYALAYRVGTERTPETIKTAIARAETALEQETQDSMVLGLAGCALCDVGQLDRGQQVLKRAVELDPTNGQALAADGSAKLLAGDFDGAVRQIRAGINVSPADSRLGLWEAVLSMAELARGDIAAATEAAQSAMSRDDQNYLSRLTYTAICAAAGDHHALNRATRELLRVHPELSQEEILHFVGPDLNPPIWAAVQTVRAE